MRCHRAMQRIKPGDAGQQGQLHVTGRLRLSPFFSGGVQWCETVLTFEGSNHGVLQPAIELIAVFARVACAIILFDALKALYWSK